MAGMPGPRAPKREARAAAVLAGSLTYYTGVPCSRGHVTERYTRNCICLACNVERTREFNSKHPDKKKEWDRLYRVANLDSIVLRQKRWDAENPGRNAARTRAWNANNPELVLAQSQNKRAQKRLAIGRHTASEIRELAAKQKHKCANCRASIRAEYHADHIMPLSLGGRNDIGNIQLLCPPCNLRKHAKHPIVWAQQEGRLL